MRFDPKNQLHTTNKEALEKFLSFSGNKERTVSNALLSVGIGMKRIDLSVIPVPDRGISGTLIESYVDGIALVNEKPADNNQTDLTYLLHRQGEAFYYAITDFE